MTRHETGYSATVKVLITGGTGFVGAWTAKAAQDAGHQVRFLVRNAGRLETSAGDIGVDISDHVIGDIADASSTKTALEGCDAVIHCAAMVSTDPDRTDEMLHTNLEGARNILGGAVAAGLDPIVRVELHRAVPARPRHPARRPTGRRRQRWLRPLQGGGGSLRTGPSGRRRPSRHHLSGNGARPPAGEQFGEAAEGVEASVKMRGVPGRSAAWIVIDVRDLADLHVALLEPGRGPRRYMAGGARVPVDQLAKSIGAAAGRTLFVYPVPDVALRSVGRVFDLIGGYLPFDTPIDSAAMQYYTQMPESDDSPASVTSDAPARSRRDPRRHRRGTAARRSPLTPSRFVVADRG